jgi:hypothetical protein
MATTPKGYPYPVGTDLVKDGDNAIQSLATVVDTQLPARVWVGFTQVNVSGTSSATIVVTFPVGRFTQTPRVFATVAGTSVWFPYVMAVTATSVTVGCRRPDGSTAGTTVNIHLHAVQMLATSGDG